MKILLYLILIIWAFGFDGVIAQTAEEYTLDNPVTVKYLEDNLRKETPRLILNSEIEKHLKSKLENDSVVQNMYKAIKLNASEILSQPILERRVIGRRLLLTSREMLYRINILGMVYQLEQDQEVLERINKELLAVVDFEDWNPSHFLDVAEMAMAVALAIDWIGSDLPESTVIKAKKALIEKGIKPSYIEDNPGSPDWIKGDSNWNQVCHGGMIAASIVIAEDEPELAAKTISRAFDGIPYALKEYGPDGVYPEGPTYWNYGTSFSALTISMLESSFNTDFGLSGSPGFMESADFILLNTAPSGKYFNFADSHEKRKENGNLTLAWFAAKTGNKIYYEEERFLRDPQEMEKLAKYAGAGLVWLAQFEATNVEDLPLSWKGKGTNPVVYFRGMEDESQQYYFAAKGRRGNGSHGNLDAGSFVFELNGVRWAIDLGNQDYHILENAGFNLWDRCQDCERWTLLTKNNFGHNTLTVNDALHAVDGFVPIVHFSDNAEPEVIFDMSEVFNGHLKNVQRKFVKETDNSLLIEDHFKLTDSTEMISWQMMTTSEVFPNDEGAVLKKDGKKLNLKILSPADVHLSVLSLDPPLYFLDKHKKDLKRIEIKLPSWYFEGDQGEIKVQLSGKID